MSEPVEAQVVASGAHWMVLADACIACGGDPRSPTCEADFDLGPPSLTVRGEVVEPPAQSLHQLAHKPAP